MRGGGSDFGRIRTQQERNRRERWSQGEREGRSGADRGTGGRQVVELTADFG